MVSNGNGATRGDMSPGCVEAVFNVSRHATWWGFHAPALPQEKPEIRIRFYDASQ
jgi:hypothetical protein